MWGGAITLISSKATHREEPAGADHYIISRLCTQDKYSLFFTKGGSYCRGYCRGHCRHSLLRLGPTAWVPHSRCHASTPTSLSLPFLRSSQLGTLMLQALNVSAPPPGSPNMPFPPFPPPIPSTGPSAHPVDKKNTVYKIGTY